MPFDSRRSGNIKITDSTASEPLFSVNDKTIGELIKRSMIEALKTPNPFGTFALLAHTKSQDVQAYIDGNYLVLCDEEKGTYWNAGSNSQVKSESKATARAIATDEGGSGSSRQWIPMPRKEAPAA